MPFFSWAQITYFSSASSPADNGTAQVNPTVVTPPASMQAGDLVIFVGVRRASGITLTISQAGGQVWNALPALTGTTNVSPRIFWCRFNGTWSANPSIAMSGTGGNTAVMHVFRPSTRGYSWAVDVAQVSAAPATAQTVSITGITNVKENTVTFAAWFTADENSWDQLTAGWATPGSAQYRNLQGQDMSATFAYRIATTSGATGNVSKRQATLGNDAARTAIVSFYPYRTSMPQLVLE